MLDTIIFDLGGVVLNRGIWLFRGYLVKTYKVTDEDTIKVFIKRYYTPYFSGKISEVEFWQSAIKDLGIKADWIELKSRLLNFFEPYRGMFELVDSLKNKGYKTVLLSDQTKEWWPYLNAKYGIERHFDCCIISSEVGIHKPDPRIYQIAVERSGSRAENALYIDDLESNLVPAKGLGMRTLLFEDSDKLRKELVNLGII